MPLFGSKKSKKSSQRIPPPPPPQPAQPTGPADDVVYSSTENEANRPPAAPANEAKSPPKLIFHCQLAHGSPTGVISGFSNVKELYEKIAACYDMDPAQILFCTLNSHKVDMTKLLTSQLGLDDFIFAHCYGQAKVVDIEKTEEALGLTITDNGLGCSFIKAIKPGSIVASIEGINPGDHISKIGEQSMVGVRHVDVAKALKAIPKGTTFSLRVVEPLKSGFSEIGGKSGLPAKKAGVGTGKATVRLRAKGAATVEERDETVSLAIDKINSLMEGFLGINDAELAQTIWETANEKKNPSDFALAIDESDLRDFGFTEAFIFDLWGAITDAKEGRLQKAQDFHEAF